MGPDVDKLVCFREESDRGPSDLSVMGNFSATHSFIPSFIQHVVSGCYVSGISLSVGQKSPPSSGLHFSCRGEREITCLKNKYAYNKLDDKLYRENEAQRVYRE